MNMNKWTLGLAAVGLVSLASVAKAEEAATPLLTALSSTTISGYVDTSAQWNPGTGTTAPGFSFAGGKRDGFNLNAVSITLDKPLEEGEWSAGYKVDFLLGPDGGVVTTGQAIRQAYVAMRVPVGNGLDFKLGRFDTIVGYESTDSYKNPNFTRSYGYTIQPLQHEGLLATYQVIDALTVNAGVANVLNNGIINARSPRAETQKALLGSIALTAPDSWGALAGSALYAGIVDGFGSPAPVGDQTSYYVGATIATPVEGLRFGASWDFLNNPAFATSDTYAVALYGCYTYDKLGFHLRGEYANGGAIPGTTAVKPEVIAVTGTIQYDLWENVLSRLEVRWDHDASGSAVRPWNAKRNDYLVAANLVYKF